MNDSDHLSQQDEVQQQFQKNLQDRRFFVKNCSLSAIATGERANSLLELRDKLAVVDEGCIYYHFWGGHMNPQFVRPQYHNDFASWVYHRLHDHVLAEKLSIIDPTEFENLEELRQELIETVEKRIEEHEIILWTKKEDQFFFIRSIVIVFETILTILEPKDLPHVISILPPSSIYYHFIDARSRTPEKIDDFSFWLKIFGEHYQSLIENIQTIDPYFLSLTEIKDELIRITREFFK